VEGTLRTKSVRILTDFVPSVPHMKIEDFHENTLYVWNVCACNVYVCIHTMCMECMYVYLCTLYVWNVNGMCVYVCTLYVWNMYVCIHTYSMYTHCMCECVCTCTQCVYTLYVCMCECVCTQCMCVCRLCVCMNMYMSVHSVCVYTDCVYVTSTAVDHTQCHGGRSHQLSQRLMTLIATAVDRTD
jgi:hypothetical protein